MRTLAFLVIVVAAAVGLGMPAATGFREDFATLPAGRLQSADWQVAGAEATVEEGRLRVRSERSNPEVTLRREFRGDTTYEVRLRRAPECHWAGMVAHGVYWLTVNRQFGTLSLIKRDAGKETRLGEVGGWTTFAFEPQDIRLRVLIHGSTIRACLDDKVLITAEDPDTPPAGRLMLVGGWGTDALFDDIRVTPGAEAPASDPGKPQAPPVVKVSDAMVDRDDGIYHDGESATVTYSLASATGEALAARLRFRLVDYYEQTGAERTERVELPAAGERRGSIAFAAPRRGAFKVALDAAGPGGEPAWVQDLASWVVVPKDLAESPPSEESPFGAHLEQIDLDRHLRVGRKLGVKWVRGHNHMQWTWWIRVEPKKGEFRWGDEAMAKVRNAGFHMMGQFLHTPLWAADLPPGTRTTENHYSYSNYPPRDLKEFGDYVTATVSHYKGSIRTWEVWNEPHYHGFWRGTPERYAELSKVAYEAAKRADPDCKIVGGGGISTTTLPWMEKALKAGIGRYMDVFSIHGYIDDVHPLDSQVLADRLPEVRRLLDENGAKGVPIWNSENGVESTSFLDQYRARNRESDMPYHFRQAANNTVRLYVANLAAGVQKVFWYYCKYVKWEKHDHSRIDNNLLDYGGVPKPCGVAYATTARWLEGTRFVSKLDVARSLRCHLFRKGDRVVVVTWALFGRSLARVPLSLPEGGPAVSRVVDIMGNETPLRAGERPRLFLSKEPVFLVFEGASPEAVERRLKGAVFEAPAE